jgi:EmrB/QacA subfamily drug resistance transporter
MMPTNDARARNRLLGVLFLGVLMAALDIAIVGPALPMMQADFGVDERALAWVFAIYVLFNLIGTPLMAKLSDSFGRRAIYTLDIVIFAIGSLMVALAPSFAWLLVGRAVQGLGAGGIIPVASAVIGDTFPVEQRGTALGLIGAVFGIAFLLGPILGGVLLIFGWHWLFLINLPVAAFVIGLGFALLPTSRPAERKPFDWAGMLVLTALLSSLAYGLNQIDSGRIFTSLSALNVWPFSLAAIALVPVFVVAERRAVDPIISLGLFRSRQIALAAGLAAGAGLSETAIVFIPGLLVTTFGVSSSAASFMLLPMVLAMAVASPLSGRALDRVGSRSVVLAGTALIAAALLIEVLLLRSLVAFYAFSLLCGLGIGVLLGASLRYIVLNEAPIADRAAAQGVLTIFTGIGQLIGSVLVGAVIGSIGGAAGYGTAYLLVAVVMLVLTLAALGLKRRDEEMATVQRNNAASAGQAA